MLNPCRSKSNETSSYRIIIRFYSDLDGPYNEDKSNETGLTNQTSRPSLARNIEQDQG
jgi:hypothetical protein